MRASKIWGGANGEVAIAGIIGPGLLVGSGNALKLAGPGGVLISFALVGLIVYFVM